MPFYKAATAESQSQLWEAATEFNNALVGLLTAAPGGGLLKLDVGQGLRNTTKLLDAGRRLWQELDGLTAGFTNLSRLSLSDAIAIPFRIFSDADTAVGKLLQFGKEGVTEFLKGGLSKFSGGLPTIDGLMGLRTLPGQALSHSLIEGIVAR
ncbi:MAG: hypothetical protein HC780_13410 [Leptolyngbyaceae cyanobacterium CSU_1_3]|nr:hypothetical protein [Leptolyngbyaceae cyanobacterium CSU_1_3]